MNESTDPIAARCWAEFDSRRYVERELDAHLAAWLTDKSVDRPIMSLVGPPGVGKSWLLARLRWAREQERKFVLWLDAQDLLNPDRHERVKLELIRQTKAYCPTLTYSDVHVPPLPQLISDITQRLCRECSQERFPVLLDGCDDVGVQEFWRLQQDYLSRFDYGCVRLIMPRRFGWITQDLKGLHKEEFVDVFKQEQVDCLRGVLRLNDWPPLPKPCSYQWNYPYINCYLLTVHADGQPITVETLTACCRSVIERARLGGTGQHEHNRDHLLQGHLLELKQIAKAFPTPWSTTDFRARFGKDFEGSEMTKHGLVTQNTPYYTIVDGLRELLQALPD